jgi:integrase
MSKGLELVKASNGNSSDELPTDVLKLVYSVVKNETNKHTQRAYHQHLMGFFHWLQAQPSKLVNRETLIGYRDHLAKDFRPSTVNLKMASLRKLAEVMYAGKLIDAQDLASIKMVKGLKALYRKGQSQSLKARWLTLEEMQQLCALDLGRSSDKREAFKGLVTLLCLTGLRIEEAASLKCGQVREVQGRWALVDVLTKGGKLETFPLPQTAYRMLHHRLDNYPARSELFEWSASNMRQLLKKAQKMLGWESLTPHDLRRSFARLALDSGATIDAICAALGHASPKTTLTYLGDRRDLSKGVGDLIKL